MSERKYDELTIYHAQSEQPWVLPLSKRNELGVNPNIWGSHATLHAAKSVGKIATVFEDLDHSDMPITKEQVETIRAMAANLITIALRVEEKNNVIYPQW